MGDKTRGLYDKFLILRTDLEHLEGKKHHKCQYFVLDLTHDPYAIPALKAYAEACKSEYPLLAQDLSVLLEKKGLCDPEWEYYCIEDGNSVDEGYICKKCKKDRSNH